MAESQPKENQMCAYDFKQIVDALNTMDIKINLKDIKQPTVFIFKTILDFHCHDFIVILDGTNIFIIQRLLEQLLTNQSRRG